MLADLGVTQAHRRLHIRSDDPFSEAQFRTLKCRLDFPGRYASIAAARQRCQFSSPAATTDMQSTKHRVSQWEQ
jgi:hypothetical protein